ncbi:DUF3742 family protein [Ectopseudomonas hydrolytica]|uniref:DUF3742 family protein n=1 Tax=Ectopseudomonas hydrolytica TaxID=2493633 RepID=UPI003EE3D8FD
MISHTHNERWSHRLGRRAGHAWRGYLRREQRAAGWLVARGVPAGATTALLWLAKLLVLGVLLYVAFWFFLLVFVLLVARGFAHNEQDEDLWAQQDELRHGTAGYGLYSSGGQRIDPHDPNNPYDE